MGSIFKHGKNYFGSWVDEAGKRKSRSLKTTDKAVAQRLLSKIEADIALRRDGVIDRRLDKFAAEGRKPIAEHIAAFEVALRARGSDRTHVYSTISYVEAICEHAGFKQLQDIEADGVNAYANHLRQVGRANRTIQANVTAMKGFVNWLIETNKLQANPLVSVKSPDPKADRRYERRMLLPEEWAWLQKTISGVRFGVPAEARLLLYATAIQTGLRSTELRSLTKSKLSLTGDKPYIRAMAGSTKNRKDCRQYIKPDLAARLARFVKSQATATATVFPMPDKSDVSAMFKEDLAAARAAWILAAPVKQRPQRQESDFLHDSNAEGHALDFHSLRHTCGAWLAVAGVHIKVVQTVMRHSAITLTMDTYGHLFPGQEWDAIVTFPDLETQASAAHMLRRECLAEAETASPVPSTPVGSGNKKSRKLFQSAALSDVVRQPAAASGNASCWTRTNNPLIKRPEDAADFGEFL